jgi:hypothetical protein
MLFGVNNANYYNAKFVYSTWQVLISEWVIFGV